MNISGVEKIEANLDLVFLATQLSELDSSNIKDGDENVKLNNGFILKIKDALHLRSFQSLCFIKISE